MRSHALVLGLALPVLAATAAFSQGTMAPSTAPAAKPATTGTDRTEKALLEGRPCFHVDLARDVDDCGVVVSGDIDYREVSAVSHP